MPRSPDLVARELAAHGCELPQENLDGLASRLFPDETVMAALLGAGAVVSDGRVETKNDELLLVVTSCRVLACAYKHRRDRSWQAGGRNDIPLRRFESLYGGERADKGVVEVTARYYHSNFGGRIGHWSTWGYPKDAVDHERFTNFINLAQRQIQAVAFGLPGGHASAGAGIADQLERVVALRQLGHISEEELEQAKHRILFG